MNPKSLIVDDHEIVREGIRTLLARSGKNWEVCGEASIQTLLSGGTFFAGTSEPSPGSGENPGRGGTFFSILTWPNRPGPRFA